MSKYEDRKSDQRRETIIRSHERMLSSEDGAFELQAIRNAGIEIDSAYPIWSSEVQLETWVDVLINGELVVTLLVDEFDKSKVSVYWISDVQSYRDNAHHSQMQMLDAALSAGGYL